MWQAIADSGVLVWFILVDTLQMVNPELAYSPAYAVFFSYLGYPIFFFWVVCSIWFMVGVTVDRFIMVVLLTKATVCVCVCVCVFVRVYVYVVWCVYGVVCV